MASDSMQLQRLHEKLEQEERPAGPMTMAEAVALASRLVQRRTQVQPHHVADVPKTVHARSLQPSPQLGALAAGGAVVAAGSAWLARRRRKASVAIHKPAQRGRAALTADTRASPALVPSEAAGRPPVTATPPSEITDITRRFLLWVVMPVWQLAGIADWLCHRRARIEDNAGTRESLLHLLMLAEASIPVVAGMTLEITSPLLLLMFGAVLLHSVTGLWDVSYAVRKRTVTPLEQHVHSYLEMVPVMATAFVTVLHWPELRALLGLGDRPADWSIRRKARPLPSWGVVALLAGMAAFEVVPYLQELRRTRQHR